ncbi:MAG: glutamate-5-semialdehyde dehydrogenase [Candidatus Marinimicrobia bacterium]|nr:glutamate-5-semialdehyde dehydrogenase [Candidatus Neomarinimicrobiota bacterium]
MNKEQIIQLAENCCQSSKVLATLSSAKKDEALLQIAEQLRTDHISIMIENKKDMDNAQEKGISKSMQDRLFLNKDRIFAMAKAVEDIAGQEDPVGKMKDFITRPNGIKVGKMTIPLGVILMIYEARPNVTSDAAALCFKAGNGIILRGGSEAFHSNKCIADIMHKALEKCNIPKEVITFVPDTDREIMNTLLTLDEIIDLVIPRGGEGLIKFVAKTSSIPVLKHYKGVCHMYVDDSADLEMARKILIDGKTSRPSVCNALETLLVHEKVAEDFYKIIEADEILQKVEFAGCEKTQKFLSKATAAKKEDYEAEFLTLKIAAKVVADMDEAMEHIQKYTSDHTEIIITNNYKNSQKFINTINSSVVMVNASSRFSDGGEFGLGAEIGISTSKLHAYGPMGVESLTTEKFVVLGDGQVRHPQ